MWWDRSAENGTLGGLLVLFARPGGHCAAAGWAGGVAAVSPRFARSVISNG
jgi:hypothetical protein